MSPESHDWMITLMLIPDTNRQVVDVRQYCVETIPIICQRQTLEVVPPGGWKKMKIKAEMDGLCQPRHESYRDK